jgi:hypothetical protein
LFEEIERFKEEEEAQTFCLDCDSDADLIEMGDAQEIDADDLEEEIDLFAD